MNKKNHASLFLKKKKFLALKYHFNNIISLKAMNTAIFTALTL